VGKKRGEYQKSWYCWSLGMLNPGVRGWWWFGNILKPLLIFFFFFSVRNHVNPRASSCVYPSLFLPLIFSNWKLRWSSPLFFFIIIHLLLFASYSQQEEVSIFCVSRDGSLLPKSSVSLSHKTVFSFQLPWRLIWTPFIKLPYYDCICSGGELWLGIF